MSVMRTLKFTLAGFSFFLYLFESLCFSMQSYYSYGAGKERIDGAGTIHYYVDDQVNSARVILKEDQTVEWSSDYQPFGREVNVQGVGGTEDKTFSGKEHDETGLYYFAARYYDSAMGRFYSVDPAGEDTAYVFARNNPLRFVDLNGLKSQRYVGIFASGNGNNFCATAGVEGIGESKIKLFPIPDDATLVFVDYDRTKIAELKKSFLVPYNNMFPVGVNGKKFKAMAVVADISKPLPFTMQFDAIYIQNLNTNAKTMQEAIRIASQSLKEGGALSIAYHADEEGLFGSMESSVIKSAIKTAKLTLESEGQLSLFQDGFMRNQFFKAVKGTGKVLEALPVINIIGDSIATANAAKAPPYVRISELPGYTGLSLPAVYGLGNMFWGTAGYAGDWIWYVGKPNRRWGEWVGEMEANDPIVPNPFNQ